jgi:hypothetical protein
MPQVPVLVLSAVPNAEKEYQGIPEVLVSQTTSPDELRSLARGLVGTGQKRTA